jgi:hypothetical protein
MTALRRCGAAVRLRDPMLERLAEWWRRASCGAAGLVRLRLGAALFAGALLAPVVDAAPLPPPARAEVLALLDRLEASGCTFFRNDGWHSGARAKEHLLEKLAHVEKHASLSTAERFIEVAASSSSVTGKPYLVRCGSAEPVTSAAWLTRELQDVRKQPTPRGPK